MSRGAKRGAPVVARPARRDAHISRCGARACNRRPNWAAAFEQSGSPRRAVVGGPAGGPLCLVGRRSSRHLPNSPLAARRTTSDERSRGWRAGRMANGGGGDGGGRQLMQERRRACICILHKIKRAGGKRNKARLPCQPAEGPRGNLFHVGAPCWPGARLASCRRQPKSGARARPRRAAAAHIGANAGAINLSARPGRIRAPPFLSRARCAPAAGAGQT